MSVMRKLEVTSKEARLLHDAVVDQLIKQRTHVCSLEEPSRRALEILGTLQVLREKIWALARLA